MWLLLIPLGALWWFHRRSHRQAQGRGFGRGRGHHVRGESVLALAPAPQRAAEPSPSTSDYLRHLRDAAAAAQCLDLVKEPALAGDVEALFYAPDEVSWALSALSAPMDTITVQRDLNVLGCEPPLPEDGKTSSRTVEAITSFQERFGQVATGEVDEDFFVALRYSVGIVYAQGL